MGRITRVPLSATFTQEPPGPTGPGALTHTGSISFSQPVTQAFLEYSAATGKLTATMGAYQARADDTGLLWSNASGKVLIVAISSGNRTRAGVLTGQAFTPLPGAGNLGTAVW